jgi:hypothetical protein
MPLFGGIMPLIMPPIRGVNATQTVVNAIQNVVNAIQTVVNATKKHQVSKIYVQFVI